MEILRQGDVALIKDTKTEGELQEAQRLGHTLVEGEITGHHHILERGKFYKTATLERDVNNGTVGFVQLDEPNALRHLDIHTGNPTKEHEPIPLESETYRVIRQYEYMPDGYRQVQD
jgi:hypothetical protein